MNEKDLIFISYASPDRARVTPYFTHLASKGYDVWMDWARLKAGQNWDFEIQRALNRATLIVVFVSNNSIDRRGYVQREIRMALDRAAEKLSGDIYLIPVMLDQGAPIPEELKHIHFVRAEDRDCFEKLDDSIRHQLEQLGKNTSDAQARLNIAWSTSSYHDSWDGLPGYDAEFKLLHFTSDQFRQIGEVTDIVRGRLLANVAEQRCVMLDQDPSTYNFGQERYSRTNSWEAFPAEPKIAGKVLTLQYVYSWYWCGSAHPNMDFRSFCFLLDPLLELPSLSDLFVEEEKEAALAAIQASVRKQLLSPDDPEQSLKDQEETVLSGTESWDCFNAFVFEDDALSLSFAPYSVAAYGSGPQFAKVPVQELKDKLRPWFRNALGHW